MTSPNTGHIQTETSVTKKYKKNRMSKKLHMSSNYSVHRLHLMYPLPSLIYRFPATSRLFTRDAPAGIGTHAPSAVQMPARV